MDVWCLADRRSTPCFFVDGGQVGRFGPCRHLHGLLLYNGYSMDKKKSIGGVQSSQHTSVHKKKKM